MREGSSKSPFEATCLLWKGLENTRDRNEGNVVCHVKQEEQEVERAKERHNQPSKKNQIEATALSMPKAQKCETENTERLYSSREQDRAITSNDPQANNKQTKKQTNQTQVSDRRGDGQNFKTKKLDTPAPRSRHKRGSSV